MSGFGGSDTRCQDGTEFVRVCIVGYFQSLRTLCDKKIPDSIDRGVRAPTPLADSLLTLIHKPLSLCSAASPQNRYADSDMILVLYAIIL